MPHLLRRPLFYLLLPLLTLTTLLSLSYHLRADRASGFLIADDPLPPPHCPSINTSSPGAGARKVRWPPRRSRADRTPQLRYALLRPDTPPPPPPAIRAAPALPAACLGPWLAAGVPCPAHLAPPPVRASVIWTWVNGSDALQRAAAHAAVLDDGGTPAKGRAIAGGKLYRENGELRYSVRSVLKSIGGWVDGMYVVAGDFDVPAGSCEPARADGDGTALGSPPAQARLGQLPQWLAELEEGEQWRDGKVEMRVVSHWELGLREPVFNSFAIESALRGVRGVGDYFIYMNDDYFLLAPLTPPAFFSAPYGLVFRMQPDLLVKGSPTSRAAPSGEWAALEWSNHLLNTRFGARARPYVVHVAKALSLPLVDEMEVVFAAEFAETRRHRFRNQKDAYLTFLFPHYVVERHREALLWSFVVARLGGRADEWGEQQMEDAWAVLGGGDGEEWYADLEVSRRERATLADGRVARVLGEEMGSTVYKFSSHDGYPYTVPQVPSHSWPTHPLPGAQTAARPPPGACTLEFELCLGTEGEAASTASAVFRRVAFELPQCGDCLVMALVGKSGELGLGAFLPPGAEADADADGLREGLVPVLPLSATWQDADFSLAAVFPPASSSAPGGPLPLRALALALLSRYTYVLADTPVRFASLRSPQSARQLLKAVDKDKALAMMCVNDDIVAKERETVQVLREWMEGRWGRKAGWEERRGWW